MDSSLFRCSSFPIGCLNSCYRIFKTIAFSGFTSNSLAAIKNTSIWFCISHIIAHIKIMSDSVFSRIGLAFCWLIPKLSVGFFLLSSAALIKRQVIVRFDPYHTSGILHFFESAICFFVFFRSFYFTYSKMISRERTRLTPSIARYVLMWNQYVIHLRFFSTPRNDIWRCQQFRQGRRWMLLIHLL
jgi:hypothetical protein